MDLFEEWRMEDKDQNANGESSVPVEFIEVSSLLFV
jgi:hypothetical protein